MRTTLLALLALLNLGSRSLAAEKTQSIENRVDALLKKMTTEEKVGQLNQLAWDAVKDKGLAPASPLTQDIIKGRVGSFLNVYGALETKELQSIAVKQSRLGIPLIFGLDVIHGYKTIFPVPLAEAASWDLEAIEKSARVAATEASAAGIHWTFAPMVDIARDPRWGRIMEGAGEDPWLGSLIAAARVRGFQGTDLAAPDTILACAKHYAAYGAPVAGREYAAADMSLQQLWEIYLPPFKAAVDAGVGSVMLGFHELNGIPASANKYLVADVLKTKWRFPGFTVSDYGSFAELINHGYAADRPQAAELAFNAGGDMDMHSKVLLNNVQELIKQKRASQNRLDDAVRRILRAKFALGLFDNPYQYCDPNREQQLLLHPDHRKAALDVARKSIVLLKNDSGLLPLSKDLKSIACIGMLADSKVDMLGNWAAQGDRNAPVTLLAALKQRLPDADILYAAGYEKYGVSTDDKIAQALDTARKADLIILALGENADMSGECTSRTDIGLPHDQPRLAQSVAKLNKPAVVILFNGRPLTIKDLNDSFPAILETWLLGTEAGNAIADVLFGDYNPSGRLPVTFPLVLGQVPIYYAQKNTGRPAPPLNPPWGTSRYSDAPNDPLYPFGFGLSYTTFDYSEISLNKNKIKKTDHLEVSVTVTNTGKLPGTPRLATRESGEAGVETVQLYIRDLVASVTRPVKELRAFKKIHLHPGQSEKVSFTLTANDLGFYNQTGDLVIEPGQFHVLVGPNSRDLKFALFVLE